MKKIAIYSLISLATLGLGYVGGKEFIISASATGSDEPVEQIIKEEVVEETVEVEETETVETEVTEEVTEEEVEEVVETPAAPAQPVVEQAPVRQPTQQPQQPQYQPQEKTYSITVITPEVDTDASIEVQEQSLNDVPEMSMEEACAILASKGMSCTAE